MFKQALLGISALGMLAGLAVFAQSSAEARSQGAVLGTSFRGSERTCFDESFGGVVNRCSGGRSFVLPAVYDNSGGMNFLIMAHGVNGTALRVTCSALSVDQNTQNIRMSGSTATVRHTGETEILRPSVNAHGWGSAFAFCTLDSGTRIANYHY